MKGVVNSRLARETLLVVVSMGIVVMLALQMGREREFQVLALVAAATMAVLAVALPSCLLAAGGVLVFAGGYSVSGIPMPEVGGLLVVLGALRSARTPLRLQTVLLFAIPLSLIWIVFVSWGELDDPVVSKRFLSLVLWLLLVIVVSLPIANRPVIARGLLVGLIVSLPASLLLGSTYGNRGAGLVGDPNAFAMVVAIATPLIVGQLSLARWQALGVWSLSSTSVAVADSRTGMLALAVGAMVYVLVPVLRYWALGIPLLAMFAASRIPDDVVRGGRWEERAGSDELRGRIDDASSRQIAESPWSGHGLGSGSVDLSIYGNPRQDLTFFLHDSYKSMVTEIGLIGLSLYLVIAVGAIVQALRGDMNRGALAAIAAGGVMASQLGEVLFAVPMALAFGFAWAASPTPDPNPFTANVLPGQEVGQSNRKPTVAAS